MGDQRAAVLILVLAACALPLAAVAQPGQNAALCAAFNLAQIDYEAEFFSEEDQSDGWQAQADAFVAVAKREGMQETEIRKVITGQRAAHKALTIAYVFEDDPATTRKFDDLAAMCERIMNSADEFRALR